MKKHRKCKKIIAFVTVLFIAFVAVIGLHKTGIYRFDFLKDIYKKIDFQLSTNELNIPQDALSFSVYDIEQEEYLFYEGDSQLPTVASLSLIHISRRSSLYGAVRRKEKRPLRISNSMQPVSGSASV